VYELCPGPLVASPQGSIRLKVDDGQPKPLGAEMLGPSNRVELGATDLESVDAERESNHRSPNPMVTTQVSRAGGGEDGARAQDPLAAGPTITHPQKKETPG